MGVIETDIGTSQEFSPHNVVNKSNKPSYFLPINKRINQLRGFIATVYLQSNIIKELLLNCQGETIYFCHSI